MSLDLEAPAGTRSQEFTTLAASDDGSVPSLDVSYASRSFREVLVLILAAGLALLMWWLRQATAKTKLLLVLLTIVVPVALAPITPGWGMMIVEGLLLGGVAGVALWSLLALVHCLCFCCARWCPDGSIAKTSADTITGLLLAACLSWSGGAVMAQDAKSAPPATAADAVPVQPLTAQLPTVVLPKGT